MRREVDKSHLLCNATPPGRRGAALSHGSVAERAVVIAVTYGLGGLIGLRVEAIKRRVGTGR